MFLVTARSNNPDITLAIEDIAKQFTENKLIPRFVLYFVGVEYNQQDFAKEMYRIMKCTCIGCSTTAEYYGAELCYNSVVAIAFPATFFTNEFIKIVPINDQDKIPFDELNNDIKEHFGVPLAELDPNAHFALLLDDFSTVNQNYFTRTLNKKFSPKVTLFGGSASDTHDNAQPSVHYNGKIYPNTLIFTILKPVCKFKFHVMYSHIPTDVICTITELDDTKRIVKELNGKRAVDMFSEALELAESKIRGELQNYALGLKNDDGTFSVFATYYVLEDGSMKFFCDMIKDEEYYFMRYQDMCRDSKRKMKKLYTELENNKVLGMVQFNCIGRHLTLMSEGEDKPNTYAGIFDVYPHVGYTSSSEIFNDFINYTSASIVFYE